jgi:ubiquinone/menaquinone biosynthesis C-methylase UbiE
MAAKPSDTGPVPNIDAAYRPTHDERARQGFVGVLRAHSSRDMRDALEHRYRTEIAPAVERQQGQAPQTSREIAKLMDPDPYYRFHSALRYNAQEMMYLSVLNPVERVADEMIAVGREVAERRPAGGTLTLDPSLEMPRYVTALDVHLAPGSFHSEYVDDDLSQGAMLAYGSKVGLGGHVYRKGDLGVIGQSIGYWLTQKYPQFRPQRVLDIGTQSGKNLFGYIDSYPEIEAHGVDLSATTLRYGHARAEYLGKTVHFSQQNAEFLDYPDGYFDLIVSSFFFHELPVAATQRILKQCQRVLAPGGIMTHMELPSHGHCDAWSNFYWDWDAKYNNEPYYIQFRSQDFIELMVEAGFEAERSFTTSVPNFETTDAADYPRYLSGELPPMGHGRGGWFVFGAEKTA